MSDTFSIIYCHRISITIFFIPYFFEMGSKSIISLLFWEVLNIDSIFTCLSIDLQNCITASSPNCLQASVVNASGNGVNMQELIDTGSSESDIDHNLYENLKLNLEGKPLTITMASTTQFAKVKCTVDEELKVFNNTYSKQNIGVMEEL